MPRGPCTFKQTDVTKAIKAAVTAGVEVARVEIGKDGKIVMVIGKAAEADPSKEEKAEWRDADPL